MTIQYQQILPFNFTPNKIISQTEIVVFDHLRIVKTHTDMEFSLILLFVIQHSPSQAILSFDASNNHLILKNKAPGTIEASGKSNITTQRNIPEYFIPLSHMHTSDICFPLIELFQTSYGDLCSYYSSWCRCINPLKTKHRLLYLKTQSVPRCKHFSSRL